MEVTAVARNLRVSPRKVRLILDELKGKTIDEAIATLKPVIERLPDRAMLWNTMGSVVNEQGDYATAAVFFEEALRLDPAFHKARYNLSNCLLMLEQTETALEACDIALSGVRQEDERQMMRMARSTILAGLGRLGEAWDEYECRLHPAFADVTRGNLRLLISGPASSAGRPMPDGEMPGPGGWNRIHLTTDDIEAEVARLTEEGVTFRNAIVSGPGGRQVLVQDPAGNVVELFQPAAR